MYLMSWSFLLCSESVLVMSPKPKSVPPRLVPPPQLVNQLAAAQHKKSSNHHKIQPKMRQVFGRQAKLLARWIRVNFSLKRALLSWMVLLVASKMVLLVLTYQFFTLTAIISLQVRRALVTVEKKKELGPCILSPD